MRLVRLVIVVSITLAFGMMAGTAGASTPSLRFVPNTQPHSHLPGMPVKEVSAHYGATPNSTQSGNTCYYSPPNYGWSNNGSNGHTEWAYDGTDPVYDDFADVTVKENGWIPGSKDDEAWITVGAAVSFAGYWPPGSYVIVRHHWHYSGYLSTITNLSSIPFSGISSADAEGKVQVALLMNADILSQSDPGGSGATTTVADRKIHNENATKLQGVVYGSGTTAQKAMVVQNSDLTSFIKLDTKVNTHTPVGTNAAARVDFNEPNDLSKLYGVYDDPAWEYHLPTGWAVTCSNLT